MGIGVGVTAGAKVGTRVRVGTAHAAIVGIDKGTPRVGITTEDKVQIYGDQVI